MGASLSGWWVENGVSSPSVETRPSHRDVFQTNGSVHMGEGSLSSFLE